MKEQKQMMENRKIENVINSNKAITLIVLVITIIVLLILAGVAIATLTGENGILNQANRAKTETKIAEEEEKFNIAIMSSFDSDGKLDLDYLKSNLNNIGIIIYQPDATNEFPLRVTVNGKDRNIYQNGDVKEIIRVNLSEAVKEVAMQIEQPETSNESLAKFYFVNVPEGYDLYYYDVTSRTDVAESTIYRSSKLFEKGSLVYLESDSKYFYYLVETDTNQKSDIYRIEPNYMCFTKGTSVLTPEGQINIEDLKIGDIVYTRNMNNDCIEIKKVIQLFENRVNCNMVKIYMNDEYIECTSGHEIYVKEKGWTKAWEIEEGDILIDNENQEILVNKIEKEKKQEETTVYNFEVEDNHNYFVGNSNILVHNAPAPGGCVYEGENPLKGTLFTEN